MARYKYNDKLYDIPEEVVDKFESMYPDAVTRFSVEDDVYEIPVSRKRDFLGTFKNATPYEDFSSLDNPEHDNDFDDTDYVSQSSQNPPPIALRQEFDVTKPDQSEYVNPLTNSPDYNFESLRKKGKIETVKPNDKFGLISESINENRIGLDDEISNAMRGNVPEGIRPIDVTTNLISARNYLNEADDLIKARKEGGGVLRGMRDAASKLGTWDFGTSDLAANKSVYNALRKFERGEELSQDELRLLDAVAVNTAAKVYASDLGVSYDIGSGFVQSIPFMLEMIVNPLSGAGKGVGKALAGYAAKRFGGKVIPKVAGVAGRVVGDIAASTGMAATTGAAGVAADTYSRMIGSPVYTDVGRVSLGQEVRDLDTGEVLRDENGNPVKVGSVGKESIGSALYKSLASRSIDNFSEMFGSYFGPVGDILKETKAGKKISASALVNSMNKLTTADWTKGFNKIMQDAKYDGFFGETAEEYVGGLLNAAIVGDQSLEDLGSLDNLLQTAGTVGLMSGILGSVNLIGLRGVRYNARKGLERSEANGRKVFGDDFDVLKDELMNMDPDKRKDVVRDMIASDRFNMEQKKAIMDYFYRRSVYDGLANGESKKMDEATQAETEAIESESNPETGLYIEASRIDPLTKQLTPGTIVQGMMEDGKDRVMWKGPDGKVEMILKSEIDPSSVRSMQTQEIIDVSVNNIRESMRAEIERDSKYDPSIPSPEETIGQSFYVDGNPYAFFNENGRLNPYLVDLNGKPIKPVRNISVEDYYQAKQAEIDKQKVVQNSPVYKLSDGRIARLIDMDESDVALEILDRDGNPVGNISMTKEDFDNNASMQEQSPYERYVDTGYVDDSVVNLIADKISRGDALTPEEESMRQGASDRVESRLSDIRDQSLKEAETLNVTESISQSSNQGSEVPLDNQEPTGDIKPSVVMKEDGTPNFVSSGVDATLDFLHDKYGEKMPKKIEVTRKAFDEDLKKASEKLDKAQEAYDNAPIGKEDKVEAALIKARQEYDAIKVEADFWANLDNRLKEESEKATATSGQVIDISEKEDTEPVDIKNEDVVTQEGASGEVKESGSNLFNYFTGSLSELIEQAKKSAGKLIKKIVAPVSDRLRNDLEIKGVSITSDYNHVIDNNAIRHTLKQHGGNSEIKRGQVPVNDSDFDKISDIVENYDDIKVEDGKRGDVNIIYSKTFNDGTTIFVEEKRDKRKELAAVTMWKMKNPILTGANSDNATPIPDLNRIKRQAEREGGELLILTPKGAAASLSTLPDNSSSTDKGSISSSENQANEVKSFVAPSPKESENPLDYAERIVEAKRLHDEELKVDTTPSEAQKEAGNYKKGHIKINGFDVTIEQPAGSVRSGKDASGKEWSQVMNNTYGYIRGTKGVDGDHIDVFLGPDMNSDMVYVVDQVNTDGSFDEHKVMMGFSSLEDARSAYLSNYEEGWQGLGNITGVALDEFKKWIDSSIRKTKPFSEYRSVDFIEEERPGSDVRFRSIGEKGAANLNKAETIESSINDWSTKFNTPVRVIHDVDDITDTDENMLARKRDSKGWYDTSTGEIVIVSPNSTSVGDAQRTFLHEAVGHHGLRELFGDDFDTFLDNVYRNANEDIRKNIIDRTKGNPLNLREATEEYLAELAERGFDNKVDRSLWEKIKDAFLDMLRKAGISLDFKLSDNDLRYILWRSYKNLEQGNLMDVAEDTVMRNDLGIGDFSVRFREEEKEDINDLKKKNYRLNKKVDRLKDKIDELHSDSQLSEALKNELINEIQSRIDSKDASNINKEDLLSLLKQVKGAKTKADMEDKMLEVDRISNEIRIRSTQRRIDRLLALKTQDVNGKNMSIAKNVDDSTRRVFDFIRGSLSDIKISGYEQEMKDLRRRNRELTTLIEARGRMTEDTGLSGDDRRSASEDIVSFKKEMEDNKVRISELKNMAEDVRNAKANDLMGELEHMRKELEDKLNEAAEGKAVWSIEDSERKMALDILGISLDARNYEGAVNSINRDIMEKVRNNSSFYAAQMNRIRSMENPTEQKEARKNMKAGYNENKRRIRAEKRLLNETLRSRLEVLDNIESLLNDLVEGGRAALSRKTEEETYRRIDIVRNSIEDVADKPVDINNKDLGKMNWFKKFASSPLGSFDYMAQRVGRKFLNGDGYIYQRFVKGQEGTIAAENELAKNRDRFRKTFANKVNEIFNEDADSVLSDSNKRVEKSGVYIINTDTEGEYGRKIEIPMTKGEAMYVYMVWKMDDGRMKLEQQGFTDDSLLEIEDFIGENYKAFADWIQDDLLVNLRDRYNERYVDMYGTSMANIPNYAPLRINKNAVMNEVDLEEVRKGKKTLEEKANSLIKRTVNSKPIDLSTNGIEAVISHVRDMEEWYAFARVRRDLSWLLSSPTFRNKVNSNVNGHYVDFVDAAALASHSYHPDPDKYADEFFAKVNRGLVGANISFGLMTAAKQILSLPAFLGYSQSPKFMVAFTKNIGLGFTGRPYKWAMENMPMFYERVKDGNLGDEKLRDDGDNLGKIIESYLKIGMVPNKMIDAFTISVGAKSVYDYTYDKLRKGYERLSDDEAKRQALVDAEIFFNQTQQSGVETFLSPMQRSRTIINRMLTTYQNSNIGYVRRVMLSLYDLASLKDWSKLRSNYAERFKAEGMDDDTANQKAQSLLLNGARKQLFHFLLFGWGMNMLWDLGSSGFFGFFAGDDDEDEKYKDIVKFVTTPVKGVPAGNIINNLVDGYDINPVLFLDELQRAYNNIGSSIDDIGMDPLLAMDVLSNGSKLVGFDMERWGNIYLGMEGLIRNQGKEGYLLQDIMFLLNTPKSQRVKVAREMYKNEPFLDYAEKVSRAYRYTPMSNKLEYWVPGTDILTRSKLNKIKRNYVEDNMTSEQKAQDKERKEKEKEIRRIRELSIDKEAMERFVNK